MLKNNNNQLRSEKPRTPNSQIKAFTTATHELKSEKQTKNTNISTDVLIVPRKNNAPNKLMSQNAYSSQNARSNVDYASSILNKYLDFYENEEFCDVILIADIDNTKFKAHRTVISAASDYFRLFFRNNLKRYTLSEVRVKGIDGDTLKSIIKFMYTGSIELCHESVQCAIHLANFFQMDSLLTFCYDYMAEQVNVSNCLGIMNYAEENEYLSLAERSFIFACENFQELSGQEEFIELNEEQLCRFISRDTLEVESEEKLFHIVKAWIDHGKRKPGRIILNLLKHIRFTSLTPKFIIDNITTVCSTFECYSLVVKWLQWHMSPEKCSEIGLEQKPPRERFETLDLVDCSPSIDVKDISTHSVDSCHYEWSEQKSSSNLPSEGSKSMQKDFLM